MRSVLVLGLLISSPAVACDMDGMFGFNHYSAMAPDQAAADAMREAAIADARDKFMARHGIAQIAETDAAGSTSATAASGPAAGELTAVASNGASPQ